MDGRGLLKPMALTKYKVLVKNFTYTIGSKECPWRKIFTEEERDFMTFGLFYVGILSTMCAFWMWCRTNTAIYQRLSNKQSYAVLQHFFLGTLLKNLVGLASYNMDEDKFKNLSAERFYASCKFYGILYNFFNIFELEALTHSCIERYVNTKYIINGWQLTRFSYWIYWVLSLSFAAFYTFLPLVGFGGYGYDFNCLFCTFRMVEVDEFQGFLYFLKTIKPVSVMYVVKLIIALVTAKYLTTVASKKAEVRRELLDDAFFTTTVKIITTVNLVLWSPTFTYRAQTVISQFIFSGYVETPTHYEIFSVWFIAELAPIATAVVLFIAEWKSRVELKKVHASK